MIEDKILVFSNYNMHKNSGGPPGYLYKCVKDNLPNNMMLLEKELQKNQTKIEVKIRNKINYWTSLFYDNRRNDHAVKFIRSNSFNYKYLYFHDVFTMESVLHLIKENQIVLLQSHSPELPSQELYNINRDYKELQKNREIEKKAFLRANVLIFPNKECVAIYKELVEQRHLIKYLLTGIKKIDSNIKYPIDRNKINLLFIGRRNEIKGFNLLLESFNKATKERDDLRLFLAGSGETVNQNNIFDIGMVSTAYDWINSVDYVISLNKQSYFDLNVIESICLGTPLIMTTTEGHQFFKNRSGIIDATKKDFLKILLDTNLVSKHYKDENKLKLNNMYEQFFTANTFQNNLNVLCSDILKYYNK